MFSMPPIQYWNDSEWFSTSDNINARAPSIPTPYFECSMYERYLGVLRTDQSNSNLSSR